MSKAVLLNFNYNVYKINIDMKEWRKLRGLNDHVHYQTILISSLKELCLEIKENSKTFTLNYLDFFLTKRCS